MRSAASATARAAIGAYDGAPRGDRFHVRVRWLTCPIEALERRVPLQGRILDLGCGHGLVSVYLALSGPGRRITGVDIDQHKIALARQAAQAAAVERVRFDTVEATALPEGPWDTILITDVLYLLDEAGRSRLLAEAVRRLAPEGRLLVKETDTSPAWKYRIARSQELVSTRVLRITEGETVDYASSADFAAFLAGLGLRVEVERLDRGYLHPHVLVSGYRDRPS